MCVGVTRSIVRPMGEVVQGAKDIAIGKLQVKIDNKSRDEIGELSNTFQIMANDLETIVGDVNKVMKAISEGGLVPAHPG